MPTGTPISREMRCLLVDHCVRRNSSVDFVYENLFLPYDIQRNTIRDLFHKMQTWTSDQLDSYMKGEMHYHHSGTNILEDEDAQHYLLELLHENRSIRLRVLTEQFHRRFYDEEENNLPSLSTVYRIIRHAGLKRKCVTWYNIRRNPGEQIEYLDRIMGVNPDDLVDVDGTIQNHADFLSRYGWGEKGARCVRHQIILQGNTYAVMAAYSTKGFLFYNIYDGTVTGSDVAKFLENLKVREGITPTSYLIFDNASNQKTEEVKIAAENEFDGRFMYCSPYSPELKPVEHGFSNVKEYIRQRDNLYEWVNNPVGLIKEAFNYYSKDQSGGECARNHFQIYFDNHANYTV